MIGARGMRFATGSHWVALLAGCLLGPNPAFAQQAAMPPPDAAPGRHVPSAPESAVAAPDRNPSGAAETMDAPSTAGETELAPPPRQNPIRNGSDPNAAKHPKSAAALEQCAKLLDGLDLEYVHLDPIHKGPCGTAAPIRLSTIGTHPAVKVSPPAIVNCTVAATLYKWFETSVQPTASALGTRVVGIKNAASYMCRNQYGRPDTKLSEHALANALDIRAFILASGQSIPVLGNWPYGQHPTRPHLADMPLPNPARDHSTLPPDENGTPGVNVLSTPPEDQQFGHEYDELRRVATNPFFKPLFAAPAELVEQEDEEPEGPVPAGSLSRADAQAFLRTIHDDACKMFWTVLGPEANAAHRDHFHVDMRKRRYVRICD